MFVNFRMYTILEEAERTSQILHDNNIESVIKDVKASVDVTFTNNLQSDYWIQVKESDLKKALDIFEKSELDSVTLIDDHYFHDFNNEELLDVLKNYSDWSIHDYRFAQQLLEERGQKINDNQIEQLKENHIKELAQPIKAKPYWLIIGYFTSFMGGLLGVFMGWFYWNEKNKLPNGEIVYRYDKSTQTHGKYMFALGSIIIVASLIFMFVSFYLEMN